LDLSDDLSGIRDITDRCHTFLDTESKHEKLLTHDVKFLLEKRIIQTCYSRKSLVQFVPLFIPNLAKAQHDVLKGYMREFPAPVALAMFVSSSAATAHTLNGNNYNGRTCEFCRASSVGCEYCTSCQKYLCSHKCKNRVVCVKTATYAQTSGIDSLVEDLLKIMLR